MIRWEKKYLIGVEKIDHQHKWLFDFVNALEKQLLDSHKEADIEHILFSIEDYAQKHFQYEEQCMHRWKCPVAKKNKNAHKNFIEAYENFMERYAREGHSEELAWRIHDMCEKWIVNHICQIDVHLSSCNKEPQVKKK